MSIYQPQLPASRRAALSASRMLARWALGAEMTEERHRELLNHEDREAREQQRNADAARLTLARLMLS